MSRQFDQSQYVCLFCNEGIEPSSLDPCALHLVARFDRAREDQKEQTFFCHVACLQSKSEIDPANFYLVDPDFPTVGESNQ